MNAQFSPEHLQAGAVNGLKFTYLLVTLLLRANHYDLAVHGKL